MSRTMRRTFKSCGPTDLTLQWCRDRKSDYYRGLPFISRLAWRLRQWADFLESRPGNRISSYTLSGDLPKWCRGEDWDDALCFGVAAAQQYLADLELEQLVDNKSNDKP